MNANARAVFNPTDHPDWELHHQMNLFLSRYVALESRKIGHGGNTLLPQITGVDMETIRRGRRELDVELANRPAERIRQEGGRRPPVEKKTLRSRRS